MAASGKSAAQSFMLVYDHDQDPSREETTAVMRQLEPFSVEEVVPGTYRVIGDELRVKQHVDKLGNWRLAPEGHFELSPPHRPKMR